MKLLLLLVSLFPLGDEDLVMDSCQNLLLREHVAPGGLGTHVVHCCLCIQSLCDHQDHTHCSSHCATSGTIHCSHSPVTIGLCLLKESEFLASDSLPGLRCIIGDTSTGGYIIKKCPDSLLLRSAVQTFVLEKSKSGATATTAPQQKMATRTSISCCFKQGETKLTIAMKKICSQQIAEVKKQDDGQHPAAASVNQPELLDASAPNSGRSSMKMSALSKLETQRNAAGLMKINEDLNLGDEPSLQKEQLLIKSASRVDDDDNDDDGVYANRQLSLVSREKEATERQLYNLRAARDNNKTFNREKITQQAELRPPERESEKLGSSLNAIKDGKQKASANVLKSERAAEGAEGFITLFLPDAQMETQTHPASAKTLIPATDPGRKAIKELSGCPPMDFLQKLKHMVLEMKVIDKTLIKNIESAESFPKAAKVEGVKDTTEKNTETNAPRENMRINQIKQEGKESVIPPPPVDKIIEPETMKTDQVAEATSVNTDIKETTSRTDTFNQSSQSKADGPPRTEESSTSTSSPEPTTDDAEPRCRKCKTAKTESRTGKLFPGLRMKEDVLADLMKFHRSEVKAVAATNRPGNGRREDDPGGNSLKCSKPLETGHGRAAATDEPMCRGLIHRTAAGWKHCAERFAGAKTLQPEAEEEREQPPDPEDKSPDDDQYEHFYYLDGVRRRVQRYFYPRSHRRMSNGATVRRKRTTDGNLLLLIQRLVLKKKLTVR